MKSKELVPHDEELLSNVVQLDAQETKTENRKMMIGICIAILAGFCYVSGLATFQRIHDAPPDFQLNLMRYSVGLTLITTGLCVKRMVPRVSLWEIKWMVLAGTGYISYQLLLYKNEVRFLPLGTVGSLLCGLFIY